MKTPASLKWRLALVLGALALVSALLLSEFAARSARRQIENDQGALLQHVAQHMTAQLATDMANRGAEIVYLAQDDRWRAPRTPAAEQRALLERMRQSYPFYAWLGLADASGRIVLGTSHLLEGQSVAQRAWFLQGREGLHFGDAHDAFLLAKLLPKPQWDDLPLRLVDVSAPVRDDSGRLIGVLCGHLSLDWAFEARQAMLNQLPSQGLDLLVLNRTGQVLMGTPQLPSLKVDLSGLRSYQGLAQQSRALAADTWPDGQDYLSVAVREAAFRHYPGLGWVVLARKPLAQAMAPAQSLSLTILAGGALAALLFMAVLVYALHRQLRPLQALAQAAQHLRENDLQARIPELPGQGELAELAHALADMVRALQARNADLRLAQRVFDETGQGILITDADNRILRVNPAFCTITGYAPAEVLGRNPSVLASGEQDAAFYHRLWQTLQHQGRWQGEIINRSKSGFAYPEWLTVFTLRDATGAVTHHVGIFEDITLKKEYEQRLLHLAHYDALTELPNRTLLAHEAARLLAQAAADAQSLALLFIDLNQFKHINDSLGHPAGDAVLREVARRFAALVLAGELLARWGGDEFVLVLPRTDAVQAAARARQLAQTLERPFVLLGQPYRLSMSVGIALHPADGQTAEALLRCADIAMYRAKADAARLYCYFEASMNVQVGLFLATDHALREELAQGGAHLWLALQPQFSPDGRQVLALEALVRWTSPDGHTRLPAEFITVAEQTGQIDALGAWVLNEAARCWASLARAGWSLPMAVNMSALQLRDAQCLERVRAACAAHAMPAAQWVIEVTESALLSDETVGLGTLQALRSLGCSVSLDDFGTGYACLSSIQKIQPDEIKIDRSFVERLPEHLPSRHLIEFTLALAHSLGVRVVAEGVETESQREALERMGPVRLQGFLLGRPMGLGELQALLKKQADNA